MPTKTVTVTNAVWTKVSDGPCLVDARGYVGGLRIHAGATAPALDDPAYHYLTEYRGGFPSGTNESHWVRTETGEAVVVVTETV